MAVNERWQASLAHAGRCMSGGVLVPHGLRCIVRRGVPYSQYLILWGGSASHTDWVVMLFPITPRRECTPYRPLHSTS